MERTYCSWVPYDHTSPSHVYLSPNNAIDIVVQGFDTAGAKGGLGCRTSCAEGRMHTPA
jgi:hypothetical protein